MKVGFMMLANYAEDNGGLLYIAGASWDTIHVREPISPTPGGPIAIMQGTLVARLLFGDLVPQRQKTLAKVLKKLLRLIADPLVELPSEFDASSGNAVPQLLA